MTTLTKPTFEASVCSRCAGSGKYSFNLMHGDTCYGCAGSGWKLTKRGAAAQQYLKSLRSKPASEIKVGDLVQFDMHFFKGFYIVQEIKESKGSKFFVFTRTKTGERCEYQFSDTMTFVMGFTKEEKAEQLRMALAYQETLTKAGTVAKKKIAA